MPLALPSRATSRTVLAGKSRIDVGDEHACFLCLVLNPGPNEGMLPQAETTAQGSSFDPALFGLGNVQVLKHQDGVWRCPLDKVFSALLGKGACAVALPATKPFHDTPDTAGILVLCLAGRVCALEPSAGFRGATVLDLDGFARNEEGPTIGISRHQGIGFVEVNADGPNALWFGCREGQGKPSDQRAISLDDRQAIDLDGPGEQGFEIVWNGVGEAFASGDSPDRQGAIVSKAGITPSLSHQEERTRFLEQKRTLGWFFVGCC